MSGNIVVDALVHYYEEDPDAFENFPSHPFEKGKALIEEIMIAASELGEKREPGKLSDIDHMGISALLANILEMLTKEDLELLGDRLK